MRDGMRRPIGLALLLGLLCGAPAWAQERAQVQPGSRPWSDPPAKPAEASSAPQTSGPAAEPHLAARPRGVAKSRNRTAASTTAKSRNIAKLRNNSKFQNNFRSRIAADQRRPAGSTRTGESAARTALPRRIERAVTAPRRAEARVAARPGRPVVERLPARIGAVRYVPPPDLREPTDLWIDARADRIRRARDGGYLVMRRTTIEDATGRRMQVLRPLDDEDE